MFNLVSLFRFLLFLPSSLFWKIQKGTCRFFCFKKRRKQQMYNCFELLFLSFTEIHCRVPIPHSEVFLFFFDSKGGQPYFHKTLWRRKKHIGMAPMIPLLFLFFCETIETKRHSEVYSTVDKLFFVTSRNKEHFFLYSFRTTLTRGNIKEIRGYLILKLLFLMDLNE